jgi:hypothetical protein
VKPTTTAQTMKKKSSSTLMASRTRRLALRVLVPQRSQ